MKEMFTLFATAIAIINALGYASAQEADTTPPTVVKVYPSNGATDVEPGITTISVTFSEEMMDGNWAWYRLSEGPYPPVITGPGFEAFMDKSGNPLAFYKWVFTTSGTKEEIPAFLAKMLEDGDSNVRRTAAKELKRLKDKHAIEPFTKALEDEDTQVRRIASAALAELEVDVDKPRIFVKIDPRVELLSIVISMTDWGEKYHTRLQFAYRDEVKAWFSPYREHEAVKMASQLINSGFNFDAPMGFILYHSSPPELKQLQPYSEYHITRAGGDKKRLEEFAESLRKFAHDAKFEEFWKNHRDFYSEIEAEIKPAISDKGIAEKLEHYYGVKQNRYVMIPAPLIMDGGYGPSIRAENGKLDIYEIFGPGNVKDGKPVFGSGENLAGLALHEFGHSFVGPVTEEFSERLDEFKELYEPIRADMQSQAYGMWKAAVDEHLLRAIQARFILAEKGEAAAKGNLAQEYSKGFKYVKHLYNLLPAYEENRGKYPTFEFFFPLVLNLFAELKRSNIVEKLADEPFSGVINNAWSRRYLEKAIIIKPSKNKNPEVAKQVDDYIQSYQALLKERFGVNVPILSDEEGLKANLSEHAFVVFGAPWNNAFLAEMLKGTPIEVTEKNIKIGSKSFEGENVRLISVWTNPQNKKLPIVIYTATSDAGIVNINKLFHGPTDYVIYGGDGSKLQDGFYEKDESGVWTVGF
jgi:hypothetical protein